MAIFSIFGSDLAIDLGSANTLVYKKKKGVILDEASQVAINIKTGEVIAVGNKARDMIGKSPENIAIINPLENGSISDFDFTKILIKHCIEDANKGLNLIQPKVLITASSGVNDIELKALEDACIHSGARDVYIVESSIASALGAGFDIDKSEGRLIVDFGAGNVDVALVSLNGIVISNNIKIGGNLLDKRIQDFIYDKYSIILGLNTVSFLKESIGSIDESKQNRFEEVSGRDAITGMPVTIEIFSTDIRDAIIKDIDQIIDQIKYVIEKTPPELSKDILTNGIYLTGGSSLLDGFAELLEQRIGIKVVHSEEPLDDCINGAGIVIDNFDKYKKIGN